MTCLHLFMREALGSLLGLQELEDPLVPVLIEALDYLYALALGYDGVVYRVDCHQL